ncbi:MAG TPA: hypothetical protein PKA44_08290 [Saprospiraceae bacterium]|jgi:predicted lactoylglutathione lyase|nr:hypothetical protein [Saprospiraceae bacterium]
MVKQIFINLPVKDLDKSISFYEKIGFTLNPQFTDSTAACMVWSETIFVMLLTYDKLSQFINKEIMDGKNAVSVINSLSLGSKDEVAQMMEKVVAAGGNEHVEAKDYGFMIQRSFEDLDGHNWEVFYMDMTQMPIE